MALWDSCLGVASSACYSSSSGGLLSGLSGRDQRSGLLELLVVQSLDSGEVPPNLIDHVQRPILADFETGKRHACVAVLLGTVFEEEQIALTFPDYRVIRHLLGAALPDSAALGIGQEISHPHVPSENLHYCEGVVCPKPAGRPQKRCRIYRSA